MKFLWFWTKNKTFHFCKFFSLRIENFSAEKKIVSITGSNNWSNEGQLHNVTINNWCIGQWSLEIKTYLPVVLWKVFKGYSFWIHIWWLQIFLRIYFVDRKYKVNSWDWYRYNVYIWFKYLSLKSNFHTLAYNNFFQKIRIRRDYIQFF